jgi:hypothetical protein
MELKDGGRKREGWPPTDHEKKELDEGRFVSTDEIRKTGGGILTRP